MKTKFFIAFFLCVCILLHKQILGGAVKWVLRASSHCQFDYRSLHWEKGELIFSGVVLSDPTFHAHIEKASIEFDWRALPKKLKGHLTIHHPHVSIMKLRSLPEKRNGWFDFTISAINGTLEWEGLARFSFDQNHLVLDWDGKGIILGFHDEGIEADLKSFKAEILQSLYQSLFQAKLPYGQISKGFITGRLSIGPDQTLLSTNLRVDHLQLHTPSSDVEITTGNISYHADLGLKWEFQGMGSAQAKQFPIQAKGRGFFKSEWIETEIRFGDSLCKIDGDQAISFECVNLKSEHMATLQPCISFFLPQISDWALTNGTLNGKGKFASDWNVQFEAENLCLQKGQSLFFCQNASGTLSKDQIRLDLRASDYDLNLIGNWDDWKGDVRIFSTQFAVQGSWDGEKFPIHIQEGKFKDFTYSGVGWIDPNLDFSLSLDGAWKFFQHEVPFFCRDFSKRGSSYAFDFRFKRKTWDLLRLAGTSDGKKLVFNEKSHLLDAPIQFASPILSAKLTPRSLLSINALFHEWGINPAWLPLHGDVDFQVQYAEGLQISAVSDSPHFSFCAKQTDRVWSLHLDSPLAFQAQYEEGNLKGSAKWKNNGVEFEGKITSSSKALRGEFVLSKAMLDLSEVDKMEGILEGQGHLIYDGEIESDFDFIASKLKIDGHAVENEGLIHLNYSSKKGALFHGIDLHGPFDCIVDFLQYDQARSHWIFHNAQMHLPETYFGMELNFNADLDFASDLSVFDCTMRELIIPFDDKYHHIENLKLRAACETLRANTGNSNWWKGLKCQTHFQYLNHPHFLEFYIDDIVTGRLILGQGEDPMTIDWEFKDELEIQSIEGSFAGIEASFHAESSDTLVGSARVNFIELSPFIPSKIAEVFEDIRMGKGFELKGRLKLQNHIPSFHGILSGKSVELFSYQFRTLLAHVDLSPTLVHIYDLKISDSAGMIKIDEILIEGASNRPWTIAAPHIAIIDLRPSLLTKPGGTAGPLTPLVVREFILTDLKGLLDDAKTYTAKGHLHFINSYKREETVFDLPANVFSRIVGLDLELLIPVCGDLTFEVKDGFFYLKELSNAFSEAKRSEFFLETNPPPTMDLDGNLQIYIKMKQFVLFKITESFLISIEGELKDPQFRLKKKRLFGLM